MSDLARLAHLPHLPALVEPRTERLIMRAWRQDDREFFAAINADPEVMRHFPHVQSREQSDASVDDFERRMNELGYGLWVLEVADTGEAIGFTGLNPMPVGAPGEGGIEVGWRLAPKAWGHGYATEAGRAALAVAFDLAGYDEVWSLTAVENHPSRRVMERLGLCHVATGLHPNVDPASPVAEHVFYRITREEFMERARG